MTSLPPPPDEDTIFALLEDCDRRRRTEHDMPALLLLSVDGLGTDNPALKVTAVPAEMQGASPSAAAEQVRRCTEALSQPHWRANLGLDSGFLGVILLGSAMRSHSDGDDPPPGRTPDAQPCTFASLTVPCGSTYTVARIDATGATVRQFEPVTTLEAALRAFSAGAAAIAATGN